MELVPFSDEDILEMFPPPLRKNFEELMCKGKISLCPVLVNDITPTKKYTEKNRSYGYYYTLRVPYAGKRLNWELIFDPTDISFAPDFNFNDETFHMSTDIDTVIKHIPSLSSWNVANPKSLSLVLKEFLTLYKKQQLQKLQEDKMYIDILSEYVILTQEGSTNEVEVYLEGTCVHFLINIKVDISSLPEYLQPIKNGEDNEILNPGDDTSVLKISFLKLDGSRVTSSLQLSPRLDQVLGNAKTLHIPKFLKTHSLTEYVNLVTEMLKEHVRKIQEHHNLKKEYIKHMSILYSSSMLEFDSETFSMGSLLCEINGYTCLVTIELGDLFPDEQPTVTLHSLCCAPSNKTCSEKVAIYPYNPKWSTEVMLKKLMISLAEIIPKFKNHKH